MKTMGATVATRNQVFTPPGGIRRGVIHTAVITRRNLLRIARLPQLLVMNIFQPLMFIIVFNYVFGGAIGQATGGGNYINWFLPGILVQTALFGATATSVGITEDLTAGVIDRFRSLPMARSAVLMGRTISDIFRNVVVNLLMIGLGTLMGFRIEQSWGEAVLAIALALGFGYSFSWVMAWVGLIAKTPETAMTAGFLPLFPLMFVSSIFVPTASMPDWLQGFAENQPLSVLADTIRGLMTTGQYDSGDILLSLAWIAGILAVFVPMAVRTYRRTVA